MRNYKREYAVSVVRKHLGKGRVKEQQLSIPHGFDVQSAPVSLQNAMRKLQQLNYSIQYVIE